MAFLGESTSDSLFGKFEQPTLESGAEAADAGVGSTVVDTPSRRANRVGQSRIAIREGLVLSGSASGSPV